MSPGRFAGVRAILFDVLHTLVDDSGFPRAQLRRLLEEEGHEVDPERFESVYRAITAHQYDWEAAALEEPFRSIRDRHEARMKALFRELDLSKSRDLDADTEILWERIATSRIYPEVPQVLPELQRRGYRLALISNADEDDPVIQALLEADLPVRFEAIVTSEAVGAYKPAPRIFERALQKLELDPGAVMLVGDSPASDILGGSRIGMPVIWVNRRHIEFPEGLPEPEATVSDLNGLLDLLPGTGDESEAAKGTEAAEGTEAVEGMEAAGGTEAAEGTDV